MRSVFFISPTHFAPDHARRGNALYQASYLAIFADAHNQRSRFERYLELLLDRHVEGLIVVANWLFVDIQLLADLSQEKYSFVTIGWELRETTSAP